ncbi:unnamed protein product, partial [Cyprideis torosa]
MFEEFPSGEAMRHLAKDIDERNEMITSENFREQFKKEYRKKFAPKVWHRDLGKAVILESPEEEMVASNKNIVIDPFISANPAASTIKLEEIPCDIMLLTHGHQDHVLDAETIIKRTDAEVVAAYEIASWYAKKGVEKTNGVNIGGTVIYGDLHIKAVTAVHSSELPDGTYGGNPMGYLFTSHGIDIPISGFAKSPQDTKGLIEMVGGAPLIVKLLESAQGKGVVLAETNKAAESVINAFKTLKANILVQEFIKESGGKDIRCFVVNNKVVAAMERVAAKGEFRANIHQGGMAQAAKLSPEEKKLAVKAAKLLGLAVAGVDILRSDRGPLVLEVNSSPGLQGIEECT